MKSKIKYIINLLIFVFSVSFFTASGQTGEKRQKIEAQRVAFITGKLDLSPKEAQEFWPVYNEYLGKKQKLQQQKKDIMRQAMLNIDGISDSAMEKMLTDFNKKELEIAELDNEYMVKLQDIVPPKKVMQLYIAEIQFKNFLLKQIREERSQPRINRK